MPCIANLSEMPCTAPNSTCAGSAYAADKTVAVPSCAWTLATVFSANRRRRCGDQDRTQPASRNARAKEERAARNRQGSRLERVSPQSLAVLQQQDAAIVGPRPSLYKVQRNSVFDFKTCFNLDFRSPPCRPGPGVAILRHRDPLP